MPLLYTSNVNSINNMQIKNQIKNIDQIKNIEYIYSLINTNKPEFAVIDRNYVLSISDKTQMTQSAFSEYAKFQLGNEIFPITLKIENEQSFLEKESLKEAIPNVINAFTKYESTLVFPIISSGSNDGSGHTLYVTAYDAKDNGEYRLQLSTQTSLHTSQDDDQYLSILNTIKEPILVELRAQQDAILSKLSKSISITDPTLNDINYGFLSNDMGIASCTEVGCQLIKSAKASKEEFFNLLSGQNHDVMSLQDLTEFRFQANIASYQEIIKNIYQMKNEVSIEYENIPESFIQQLFEENYFSNQNAFGEKSMVLAKFQNVDNIDFLNKMMQKAFDMYKDADNKSKIITQNSIKESIRDGMNEEQLRNIYDKESIEEFLQIQKQEHIQFSKNIIEIAKTGTFYAESYQTIMRLARDLGLDKDYISTDTFKNIASILHISSSISNMYFTHSLPDSTVFSVVAPMLLTALFNVKTHTDILKIDGDSSFIKQYMNDIAINGFKDFMLNPAMIPVGLGMITIKHLIKYFDSESSLLPLMDAALSLKSLCGIYGAYSALNMVSSIPMASLISKLALEIVTFGYTLKDFVSFSTSILENTLSGNKLMESREYENTIIDNRTITSAADATTFIANYSLPILDEPSKSYNLYNDNANNDSAEAITHIQVEITTVEL